jgi:hypothetical protein
LTQPTTTSWRSKKMLCCKEHYVSKYRTLDTWNKWLAKIDNFFSFVPQTLLLICCFRRVRDVVFVYDTTTTTTLYSSGQTMGELDCQNLIINGWTIHNTKIKKWLQDNTITIFLRHPDSNLGLLGWTTCALTNSTSLLPCD